MTPLRQTFRGYLRQRRHTALTAAIVGAFLVRPLVGDSPAAPIVFSLAFGVLLLAALYTIQVDELVGDRQVLLTQRRRRSLVGWALAVPAIAERIYMILAPSPRLYVVGAISWLLFFGFVTVSQLRSLLRQKQVTSETIAITISVYLLIGLTWGMLYITLFELHPDAFSFPAASSPTSDLSPDSQNVLPVFIYFSLTTLATIGFGDILPLTLQARYAAVAEGIAGQLYLAILVARLVGMQMGHAVRPDTRD
ncbi:MAG: hypothetical protein H6Q33_265 [Deltaproteobacteria bacterium]|nr:hypothetical protein [Deltaproteobacteria bacterium]